MEKPAKDLIVGILIVSLVISSFIWIINIFSIDEGIGAIMLFGYFFFLLGGLLVVFKEKLAIVFIIVGAVVMIGAGINLYASEEIVSLFNEKGIPILGGMAFCLVGIGFLVIPWYVGKKKKAKCTWLTDAECYTLRKDGNAYSPVWKYYYNGHEYTYCDGIYNSVGIPEVGEFTKLYLDPDNPKEAYIRMNSTVRMGTIFMGSVFLFCGVIVIYSILKQL